jgi:hypothetical protein
MMRTALVFALAALLCLALNGLRLALLEQLAVPEQTLLAPRPVKEAPPSGERPSEYIAVAPTAPAGGSAARAQAWTHP